MEAIIDSDQLLSELQPPSRTPKSRAFSDTAATAPTLAPSPSFREQGKPDHRASDDAVPATPSTTSRRPDFLSRGLSLHVPTRLEMPSPSQFPRPSPLSPELEQHSLHMQQQQQSPSITASPVTSLPRHSRGLDFSRASTNLHHSTLAEQSSPDSSPVITQRGMPIPIRRPSVTSMMLDSPAMPPTGWGSTVSSSVGSVNMLGSDSDASSSDEDASMAGDDNDDPMFATPQVHKLQNPGFASTPFGMPTTPSSGATGSGWAGANFFSPAQTSLMKTLRRSKVHKANRKTRKSSNSAGSNAYNSKTSPRGGSPPPMRSIETAASGGYFGWGVSRSRRESLALGTDGLTLSSGNDSGDETSPSTGPSTPGVVKRAVTRRGNLLPKTKGFARIRAALLEESAPIDSEVRREAETIRQVRERDGSIPELDLAQDGRQQTGTALSSPNLLPAVPESAQEDFGRELDDAPRGLGMNFAAHASRNSGGLEYWNRFDPSLRTPPPAGMRHSNSTMSDIALDSDAGSSNWRRPRARSSTSDASDAFVPTAQQPSTMNDDVALKKFKRRREDDFDIATIKRRAVSPGMSAQNSPILAASPLQRDVAGNWGLPPDRTRRDTQPSAGSDGAQGSLAALPGKSQTPSQQASRHTSGGSSVSMASGSLPAGPGKKLGMQKMLDTNDGLMKMTIE